MEKILAGLDACVKHGVSNIAYLEACLKGTPKKDAAKGVSNRNADNFTQRDYSDVQKQLEEDTANEVVEMLCKNNNLWDFDRNQPVDGWREILDLKETG